MSQPVIFQHDLNIPGEQLAAKAWNELKLGGPALNPIEKLKKRIAGKRSLIYRLNGVGIDGTPVIAKRARRSCLQIERYVYQEILPVVPIRNLHFYGLIEEEDSDFGWLFLEDACGERYSESDPLHRALASKWLGIMHAATAKFRPTTLLPHVGPDRYLSFLHRARRLIQENLSNPVLNTEHTTTLKTIIAECDTLEPHWSKIAEFCNSLPRCLVHGDFIGKNVRVRNEATGPALCVMDWEDAGWGVPTKDIGGLDMSIYWPIVQDSWSYLDLETIQRLANIGLIFRYLAWIAATSQGLACEWAEWAVLDLKLYESRLAAPCQAAGWL